MAGRYTPEAGDIVWLHFSPQAGRRPALVITPAAYNGRTRLMICCPMTTQIKGYPFEVAIGSDRPGVALADQARSLDWVERRAQFRGRAQPGELARVRAMIIALIGG